MPQRSFDFPNPISGAAAEGQLELALRALASQSAGASEPPETQPGMPWLDTSTSPPVLKLRNVANTGWVELLEFSSSSALLLKPATLGGYLLRGAPVYITSSTTYMPDAEVRACYVEAVGGGAGSRTISATGGEIAASGGGGAGAYVAKWFNTAEELSIAVGAFGSADNDGSATTIDHSGGQMSAGGGFTAAATKTANPQTVFANGGSGGVASGGDINVDGDPGGPCAVWGATVWGMGGRGGASPLGMGFRGVAANGSGSGFDATQFGAGGSGGTRITGTQPGSVGFGGVVRIWEYV